MNWKNKTRFSVLQEQILKYSKNINICNNIVMKSHNIDMNADLNTIITKYKKNIITKSFQLKNDKLSNEAIKTIRYEIFPTDKQKIIFHKWFNAYIDMYNLIIRKIKKAFTNELKMNSRFKLTDLEIDLNISQLKKEFANDKELLRTKYDINMHILDYAISDAISMYKSKQTNLKKGHIKKSRLRYLKKTKNNLIFKIEKYLCQESTFCPSKLGPNIHTKPKINFEKEIQLVGIVQYNHNNNKYYLLVRQRVINETINDNENDILIKKHHESICESRVKSLNISKDYISLIDKHNKNTQFKVGKDIIMKSNKTLNASDRKHKNNLIRSNEKSFRLRQNQKTNANDISFDPGINVFLTGLSKDHTIEIGTNFKNNVKKQLLIMDKLTNNAHLDDHRKKKLLMRTRQKLKNKVTDYHWKIIKYLTDNYKHIIIGNFSTKDMCQSNQYKMIKRIGNSMGFYNFKQRLQYKCYLNTIKYGEIDEYCTSKCCSNCGKFKKNLGLSRIYECNECNLRIGRDINGTKNIYMKSIK